MKNGSPARILLTVAGVAVLVLVAAYAPDLWSGSRMAFAIRNALGALAVVLSMRFVLIRSGVIGDPLWSPSVPWLAALLLAPWFLA